MNCCTIAYSFYERDQRVHRYAEALVQQGWNADSLSLGRDHKTQTKMLNGVRIYHIQNRAYTEKNFWGYFVRILKFFVAGTIVLSFKHLRKPYQLIHVHNVPDFLVFMTVIPKLTGAKVILDIHDILPEFFCQKFNHPFGSLLSRILLLTENISVRFADYVITANDVWREKIIARNKLPAQKCLTLLNYPHTGIFNDCHTQRREGRLNIIYPGHLSHHHGVDITFHAMTIIKKKIPFARLDVYPASWVMRYREFLEKLVRELELESCVRFHETAPLESLVKVYAESDIGLVSKRPGIFSSEAFSTKIFDFMAAGIPIVATKTKIDEYYFDDSIITFCAPEDSADMAEKVLGLYSDPGLMTAKAKRGREYAASNTWHIKKQTYLDAVSALVPKSKSTDVR